MPPSTSELHVKFLRDRKKLGERRRWQIYTQTLIVD